MCGLIRGHKHQNMIPTNLKQTLGMLNVPFAVVAELSNGEIDFIGKLEAVKNTDLISRLFLDKDAVDALNRSLEDQILPRIWTQGSVTCVVCKPNASILVGLFVEGDLDIRERYRFSKIANEAIELLFAVPR